MVTDVRRGARHPVEYTATAEHHRLGHVVPHVVNASAQGFMIQIDQNPHHRECDLLRKNR